MKVTHINEALSMVQQLRHNLLDKQRFRGFTGPVRMLSGTVALAGAGVMSTQWVPERALAHVIGWGVVFLLASIINLSAVFAWFFNDPHVKRDVKRLRPLLDIFPPLVIGGAMTFAMMLREQPDYLFGIWMCMFGLTNLATRYVLPPMISVVGVFYVICGTACMFAPNIHFTNPWPMGFVFFAGEWAAGLVLYFDRRRYMAITRFIERQTEDHEQPIP